MCAVYYKLNAVYSRVQCCPVANVALVEVLCAKRAPADCSSITGHEKYFL